MKKFLLPVFLLLALASQAQEKEKTPAAKGVVYGVVTEKVKPIAPDEITTHLVNNAFKGSITGKVTDVCRAEGCWIRIQKADGSAMLVRAKDHAFLMPENIVGKTVLIEGDATVKEVSEAMRKHYAEDAGKSKEEIAKIQGPEKNVQFAAQGVKVLD